jgi:hypothetical protein
MGPIMEELVRWFNEETDYEAGEQAIGRRASMAGGKLEALT